MSGGGGGARSGVSRGGHTGKGYGLAAAGDVAAAPPSRVLSRSLSLPLAPFLTPSFHTHCPFHRADGTCILLRRRIHCSGDCYGVVLTAAGGRVYCKGDVPTAVGTSPVAAYTTQHGGHAQCCRKARARPSSLPRPMPQAVPRSAHFLPLNPRHHSPPLLPATTPRHRSPASPPLCHPWSCR